MNSKREYYIPVQALKLQTSTGFEQRYFDYLRIHDSQSAYEETEKEYEKWYKRRRYSSYKSFREVVNRRHRKSRK